MALITYDIEQLYQRTFGTKPVVPALPKNNEVGEAVIVEGSAPEQMRVQVSEKGNLVRSVKSNRGRILTNAYDGREVWLPVTLYADFGSISKYLYLPYSVVRASCKKHIVSTPLAERQGTVKELYSADDWQITIKGFLIAQNGEPWPEQLIEDLNEFFTAAKTLTIENALTDILLENRERPEEQCRVVMESLELTETEGGRVRVQGFSMKLLGDSVFTLEVE